MNDNEKCVTCKHCKTLYVPPTVRSDSQYLKCCSLFIDENEIVYLHYPWLKCECYQEVGGMDE